MRQHRRPLCTPPNVNPDIVRQNESTSALESCLTLKRHQFMNKKLQIPTLVWTMMKMSFQQIMLYLLFCGFSYAHESYGQDILNKSVSINVEDTEFKKVLVLIEKQTNVRFVYSSSAINVDQKVNFKALNKKLETVLMELLTPVSVNYVVSDNHILLKPRKSETGLSPDGNLDVRKQELIIERKVSGNVTDEKGTGLPGVNILVKGSVRGTVTDEGGKFELGEIDEKTVLVFSFVGYLPREMLVGNEKTFNTRHIAMEYEIWILNVANVLLCISNNIYFDFRQFRPN